MRTPIFFLLAALGGCRVPRVELAEPLRPNGPLSLEEALQLALHNNPDLEIARRRVEAAQAARDAAASEAWPRMDAAASLSRIEVPSRAFGAILDQREFESDIDFNDPGPVDHFRGGLALGITLYDGGRRRARVAAAEAGVQSWTARRAALERDLALELARTWYLVFQAADSAQILEVARTTLEAHLRIAEARLEQGAARRTDVLAIRVRLAGTQEAAVVARSSAERARIGLHLLLGLDTEEPLELLPPPELDAGDPPQPFALRAAARQSRPEILAVWADVQAAEARLREASAARLPALTLGGTFGVDGERLFSGSSNWSVGLDLIESLTEVLRAPRPVRRAAAELGAALAAARKAALIVDQDVRYALLDLEEADARLSVVGSAMRLAEETLVQVETEYEGGVTTVTALLDAELALREARIRLRSARQDRALAQMQLRHAVGASAEELLGSVGSDMGPAGRESGEEPLP